MRTVDQEWHATSAALGRARQQCGGAAYSEDQEGKGASASLLMGAAGIDLMGAMMSAVCEMLRW